MRWFARWALGFNVARKDYSSRFRTASFRYRNRREGFEIAVSTVPSRPLNKKCLAISIVRDKTFRARQASTSRLNTSAPAGW
jgi:hypothetical protein